MVRQRSDSTHAMIDAFVPEGDERDRWHWTLAQIEGAELCYCQRYPQQIVPVKRCAEWGHIPMEIPPFGGPLKSCGNCYGTGVMSGNWTRRLPSEGVPA